MRIEAEIFSTLLKDDYLDVTYRYHVNVGGNTTTTARATLCVERTPANMERFRIGRKLVLTVD